MKNRNLAKTRKLKNNMAIFICCRQCTPSMQKNEINRFYLWAILVYLKWKKEWTHFVPMTSLMLCFLLAWPWTVY